MMKYSVSRSVIIRALLALPFSVSAFAQVVAPNNFTSTEGGTSSVLYPFSTFQETLQIQIDPSQLNLSVGDTITGIAFRMDGGGSGTFPSSASSFTDFTITLGQAAHTADQMSTTFANNFVPASSSVVRSGALTIPAGTYSRGSTPNSFGGEIAFTSSFTYQGGGLVVEIRNSGTSQSITPIDADATAGSGYGTTYNTMYDFNSSSTTGAQQFTPIVQLEVTPVPEPATWGWIAGASLGVFGLIRRVRWI